MLKQSCCSPLLIIIAEEKSHLIELIEINKIFFLIQVMLTEKESYFYLERNKNVLLFQELIKDKVMFFLFAIIIIILNYRVSRISKESERVKLFKVAFSFKFSCVA